MLLLLLLLLLLLWLLLLLLPLLLLWVIPGLLPFQGSTFPLIRQGLRFMVLLEKRGGRAKHHGQVILVPLFL